MARRNRISRRHTHARTMHFTLKQMTEDIDISYTMGTTTVPDDTYVNWPGPYTIDDDATVTIGNGATAEVEDEMIRIERKR